MDLDVMREICLNHEYWWQQLAGIIRVVYSSLLCDHTLAWV